MQFSSGSAGSRSQSGLPRENAFPSKISQIWRIQSNAEQILAALSDLKLGSSGDDTERS